MANLNNKRSRRWCFTLHNYEDSDIDSLNNLNSSYIVYGKETCPTTQRQHLQGYFEFHNQITGSALKKKIPKAHLIMSNGTAEQNQIYCKKEGDYYEQGEPKKQGKRTDLLELTQRLMNTELSLDDIASETPDIYHQYARTLAKIEDLKMRKLFRKEAPKAIWYWGTTGAGKSHEALNDYDPETHYIYPYDAGWWDGYKQQEIVVINEFRGQIPYSEILTLADKWPHFVRRRHREPVPFISPTIIITSSLHPSEVYKNLSQNDDLAQLYRRFKIVNLKKKYIETATISI